MPDDRPAFLVVRRLLLSRRRAFGDIRALIDRSLRWLRARRASDARGALRAAAVLLRSWAVARWPTARALGRDHGGATVLYAAAVTVLMWPMFGPGTPPGVDTPTFLHLAWVTELALTGNLDPVLTDPYWYGGWPYLQAYPPLAYGAVGLLSALSPLPIEISFRVIIFLAYVGLGLAVYGLALEFGLRRSTAVWAGFFSLLSYPLFVSLGIFGWFSTVVALPFGVAGFLMLERALRTGERRTALWSGAALAGSLLAHHMTGFAFGLGLVPWALYHLGSGAYPRRRTLRMLGYAAAAAAATGGVWLVFFVVHITGVGFVREVAGNWVVDLNSMGRRALERSFIGRELYPSYIGLVQVPLALGGVLYALVSRSRAAGAALMLITFTLFSMGQTAMPLIRLYPFSGLDIARFGVFMAPFMALFGALFLESAARDVLALLKRAPPPRVVAAVFGAVALAVLVIPVQDALEARKTLAPITPLPQVALAMEWLRTETPPGARILNVGFRNWDAWWVPEQSGRPIMDGWNDEGAPEWQSVREVRHMGWFGRVNSLRLYDIMEERETDYVVVYHWHPIDSPALFETALAQDPFLFKRRASWSGLTIFERLGAPGPASGGGGA